MRIAFIARSTLFTVRGGDTRQMEMTAKYLRKLGVSVDIRLSGAHIEYKDYDLLHFFNIIRPADIMVHVERSGLPFVISPIFVEYDGINEKSKGGLFSIASKLLGNERMEYVKSIARWVLNGEKITSKKYLLLGHGGAIKWLLNRVGYLLPNSESEMRRFRKAYNTNCTYHIVPNGIDTEIADRKVEQNAEYKDAVICVARFEPLKNQLALIEAMRGSDIKVYLHGKPSPNNIAYYEQCVRAAGGNIQIRDWLEGDELFSVFASARVHALPSYFETTGLSSLEAAVMGCNIVVTNRGDQPDYFKGDAWYCKPDDVASIRKAVEGAYNAPYNIAFKQRILEHYTWQRAAEETLKAYKEVLKD
ncbi:MAG: glycosyltransferase [Sphingobacteriales bacterium]|nr:MAG: glycosyltransferase [Sphingobacteriales bacterium]